MNEQQLLIKDTLRRLLTDHCTAEVIDAAEKGHWPANLWQNLTQTGLTLAGIGEDFGGSGGDIEDSLLIIREAAQFAAPVPLAEHFIAALLLANQKQAVSVEPMTIADGRFNLDSAGKLTGQAEQVGFARWCQSVVLIADAADGKKLCKADLTACKIELGTNVAGEPRDRVLAEAVEVESWDVSDAVTESLHLMGAATRGLMMAGALESVLEMSVQYSMERSQFGRPISKFQAIQQQLAVLAGEVAASTMAGHAIVRSFEALDELDIAIGKSRIGDAVGICTDIAHQVHGAMGYTMEHTLNHRTRRLWSWRDEFGGEPEWQKIVGQAFLSNGTDQLWDSVTKRA